MENVALHKGMLVRSIDGDKVGKVIATVDNTFMVEKGILFPEDYTFNLNAIERIEGDTCYVRYTMQQVKDRDFDLSSFDNTATSSAASYDTTSRTGASAYPEASNFSNVDSNLDNSATFNRDTTLNSNSTLNADNTVRVPLKEEQIDVQKTMHEAGEIRLHKTVVTETRHIEVPVMREEVSIERVQVPPGQVSTSGSVDSNFEETSISVPIREEEIEIRKRPVVKEEIRVTKNVKIDERKVDTEVRHEEAYIEKEGNVKKISDTPAGTNVPRTPKAS